MLPARFRNMGRDKRICVRLGVRDPPMDGGIAVLAGSINRAGEL
jgi:hypothetical protein